MLNTRRPRLPFDQLVEKGPDCWTWVGPISTSGYGRYKHAYAHRWSYEQHVGPIPEGLHIDHLCRNRLCVNPAHLEAVTQAENNRRSMAPRIILWRENRCHRGHDLNEAYVDRKGFRSCRACVAIRRSGTCDICGKPQTMLKRHKSLRHGVDS